MSYVADRISLDINRNVTIGLLGESGSGKTQLAMTISGLNTKNYHMEEGCIEYNFDEKAAFTVVPNDQNLSAGQIQFRNLPKKLRKEAIYGNKIGFMFQDPGKSLNPYWTIGRHFNEIARTKKNSNITSYMHRKEKIYSALRLDADLDFRYPDQLSGGQQQRIVIALVLISEPDLIIADEIATGVDVSVKRELMDYLLYIKHHTKSALLIITHDIGFILKVADRIILMYKGTAFQSLDADIVRSVILSFRFANQLHQKSKEYSTQMKQASAQLDVISKELHPYLRELLRSYLFRISLKGDIPDPTKPTGESCPFANRCPDRMDECSQIFPRVTSSSKGWIRCMKFEQNHDN
jgi:oligopeptide/dipeptide ABC transporter ATP-binding protein